MIEFYLTIDITVSPLYSRIVALEEKAKAKEQRAQERMRASKAEEENNANNQDKQKQTDEETTIRSERTGDGRGRTDSRKTTPLEGAPSVQGINGPDPRIVEVAERYAADNGIKLKRQAEYVNITLDLAKRLAKAYADMKHDPQNPIVKEA